MNRREVAVWATLFAMGLLFELHEIREGDNGVPLSRVLRALFRTDHPVGALAFEGTVVAGSHVLVRHILRNPVSDTRHFCGISAERRPT